MPILILFMGVPGSGKTTLRNQLDLSKYYLGSADELIPLDKNGYRIYNGQALGNAWKSTWVGLGQAFKEGKDVILDNTFIAKNERACVCSVAKGLGYFTVCIWLKTDLQKCLKNNLNRKHAIPTDAVAQKYVRLEKPTEKEGWDLLIKTEPEDNLNLPEALQLQLYHFGNQTI